MSNQIGTLVTFTPNTDAKSSEVNSNFSAIKTKHNLTDAALYVLPCVVAEWDVYSTLIVSYDAMKVPAQFNCTLTEAQIQAGTSPTGDVVRVDIEREGVAGGGFTSIWAVTTANKPEISDGSATGYALSGTPDTVTISKGDRFKMQIEVVGSGVAGSDLKVKLMGVIR